MSLSVIECLLHCLPVAAAESPSYAVSFLSWLLGTAIGGGAVTYFWSNLKKRRETEISALNDFYQVYGEFFTVWKLWNNQFRHHAIEAPEGEQYTLLVRATEMEARTEAFFVKITSERYLTDSQLQQLGLLRQAFQSLRERIRDQRALDWWKSSHAQYAALKDISATVSGILLSPGIWSRLFPLRLGSPAARVAARQLAFITDNDRENDWRDLAGTELRRFVHRHVDSKTFTATNAFELHQWIEREADDGRKDDAPSCLNCEKDNLPGVHRRLKGLKLDSRGWVLPIRHSPELPQDPAARQSADEATDIEWISFVPESQWDQERRRPQISGD